MTPLIVVLRYFTAVVQWKGYREASRRLHVAQPAISQTVADLEYELGLKLSSRAKRIAQLTPEGEIFSQYPGVKLTLQELTPLQQEAAFQRGEI